MTTCGWSPYLRKAVEVAYAERIGHGVAVLGETDSTGLLAQLKQLGVMVEIGLSSNIQILEVSGSGHPLASYIQSGVPVALATDDQGVSRSAPSPRPAKFTSMAAPEPRCSGSSRSASGSSSRSSDAGRLRRDAQMSRLTGATRGLDNPRVTSGGFTRRLTRPLSMARLAWVSGALSDPFLLAKRLRWAADLRGVSRSLFHFRSATALLLGHELGLFRALGAGPRTETDLACELDVHQRSIEALGRILESQGVLVRKAGELRLSRFARAFIATDEPESIGPMLDLMAAQAGAFPDVVSGMRTGKVPPALDILSETGRHRAFLDAVNAYLLPAMGDLVSRVELPDVKEFIVGSMGVSASTVLLDRFPRSRVTYGCLEHLVREIPRLRERYAVPAHRVSGMHEHGGDPEADRWGEQAFDLVLLTKKMILSPEQRTGERFARKAFEVLRSGGVAVLWECIHPDVGPTSKARAMEAVLDLVASPQGTVSTEGSVRELLQGVGYAEVRVVPCLAGETTFVVARKR
jgi:hypothetical protein